MPRHPRPNPETGLIEAPTYQMQADAAEMAMLSTDYMPSFVADAAESTPPLSQTISGRTRSPSDRLTYPALQQPVETIRNLGGVTPVGTQVQIMVERDHARQMVSLHLRAMSNPADSYSTFAVPERIFWRAVEPGDQVRAEPLMLDERAARQLAEQLAEFNPDTRRLQRTREQLDQSQSEMRSMLNQLEEVRNHNATLVRTNQEQQRQVRWLERELRDANVERREAE